MEWSQPAARMGACQTGPPPECRLARAPTRLRSPFARAVVPVLGGIARDRADLLRQWIAPADLRRRRRDDVAAGARRCSRWARCTARADSIAEDGPILFPGLNTTRGDRTLVLDHEGDDRDGGWQLYWGYPADRDADCPVDAGAAAREFTDCDGRSSTSPISPAPRACSRRWSTPSARDRPPRSDDAGRADAQRVHAQRDRTSGFAYRHAVHATRRSGSWPPSAR